MTEPELGEAGYEAFALDAEIDDNYVVAVPGGSSARRRRGRLPATDILP